MIFALFFAFFVKNIALANYKMRILAALFLAPI